MGFFHGTLGPFLLSIFWRFMFSDSPENRNKKHLGFVGLGYRCQVVHYETLQLKKMVEIL